MFLPNCTPIINRLVQPGWIFVRSEQKGEVADFSYNHPGMFSGATSRRSAQTLLTEERRRGNLGQEKIFNFAVMVHKLKTWSKYFSLVKSGEKPFELRKNDRGFLAGHELLLREYNPQTQTYTGQTLRRKITCVLEGSEAEEFGLKPGYCVMGLAEIE
jgi:hypothetical protein